MLLAALVLAGCGGSDTAEPEAVEPEAASETGVKELSNVLELRSDFEAGTGKTRLLLLFSPT
jgi:hypothetical protein